jgi:hypothetical protein
VKDYPKGKRWRRFKLSPQNVAKLKAHAEANNLTPDDLFFSRHRESHPELELLASDTLTFEAPNGRTYTQVTTTAYTTSACANATTVELPTPPTEPSAAPGQGQLPHPRVIDDGPHISANWFRKHCRHPARVASNLGWSPRIHDLRHAHASWLLAGGADLQVVKERLGHRKISTTERYLHTLPTADETALEALAKIRTTQGSQDAPSDLEAQLAEAQAKISQLQAVLADQLVAQHAETRPNLRSV